MRSDLLHNWLKGCRVIEKLMDKMQIIFLPGWLVIQPIFFVATGEKKKIDKKTKRTGNDSLLLIAVCLGDKV